MEGIIVDGNCTHAHNCRNYRYTYKEFRKCFGNSNSYSCRQKRFQIVAVVLMEQMALWSFMDRLSSGLLVGASCKTTHSKLQASSPRVNWHQIFSLWPRWRFTGGKRERERERERQRLPFLTSFYQLIWPSMSQICSACPPRSVVNLSASDLPRESWDSIEIAPLDVSMRLCLQGGNKGGVWWANKHKRISSRRSSGCFTPFQGALRKYIFIHVFSTGWVALSIIHHEQVKIDHALYSSCFWMSRSSVCSTCGIIFSVEMRPQCRTILNSPNHRLSATRSCNLRHQIPPTPQSLPNFVILWKIPDKVNNLTKSSNLYVTHRKSYSKIQECFNSEGAYCQNQEVQVIRHSKWRPFVHSKTRTGCLREARP